MTAPQVRFQEPVFHDDDIAAAGDDIRDWEMVDQLIANGNLSGGWRPDPKDLA